MAGFPLSGIDPTDPTPGLVREFKFNQGPNGGAAAERKVVLLTLKASSGSATLDKVTDAISDEEDAIDKMGYHSLGYLMYKWYTKVDPLATVHLLPVTAGSGSATVDFTFATTSTGSSAVLVSCLGEVIQVGVASGDTAATVATAVIASVNQQLHWPIVASAGAAGVVTITAAIAGTELDHFLNFTRMSFSKTVAMTVTKGAVTGGSTASNQASALADLINYSFAYHVNYKTSTSALATGDNGLGDHIAQVISDAAPARGKEQRAFVGLVGTQAQATTVATSAGANSVYAMFWHAEDNDWHPALLASRCVAILRSQEVAHPGASLVDYGLKDGQVLGIPDPFDKNDRPSYTEIKADLNNGVTPIAFLSNGTPYIVRHVTSKSLTNSVNDYRARSGHIPSVVFYAWDIVEGEYRAQAQMFVANDPLEGEKPLSNVTYPRDVKAIFFKVIDDLISNPGGPILDPSYRQEMKDSVEVVRLVDGISARWRPIAVKHNNKGQFLIEESSESV